MSIEVIVSTMNEVDCNDLYNRMNISTNAFIINQTTYNRFEEYKINKKDVRVFSLKEKGVGLSRNTGLMRAKSEICMISDDDMVYRDDYEEIVSKAYEHYPDADMILFNSIIHEKEGIRNNVKKTGRVRWYNCLRYGAVSFTFKKKSIYKKNVTFPLNFGGGTEHGSGEDSLFIWDAIKSGLKVYSVNETIAEVFNESSTWFEGYNEKFFKDKGALFFELDSKLYWFFIIKFIYSHRRIIKGSTDFSYKDILMIMLHGAHNYKAV
ncbi:glycosyltransferase family A protein [Vagococcus luciliae]|uniref:Glycosyltransferase 2-like domain-containing protein n=1 Tax=Vagococcus luciliae TaxID=2920380 RepID=A0ABY5P222_9ENTE|nr:glycosyltransferase family A protein [Vagococcus luciliae]UUV99897.1 hypothetical protein G314FT_20660 [Vagococcus luciliae]